MKKKVFIVTQDVEDCFVGVYGSLDEAINTHVRKDWVIRREYCSLTDEHYYVIEDSDGYEKFKIVESYINI